MKVILATGVLRLNKQIEQRFEKDIEIVGKPLFREAVEGTLARSDADVVILSDELEGVTEMTELILLLRARHAKARVIYIGKKMSPDFKAFLYKYNVFDILNEKFSEEEMRNAFFSPKSWEEISVEIGNLDPFINEYEKPNVKPEEVDRIEKNSYTRIKPAVTNKDSLYQEIVAFWSVLDQSGKTFSATNTALFLAANPDLKVLLLDFSIKNPVSHLHYGFQDGDKNLGALIDDMDEDEEFVLNNKVLEYYLITHPVYQNLKILPGRILRSAEKEPEFYIQLLSEILEIAQSMNFSTILIDMDSGFQHPISIYILRKATKVLLHVNESPGALFAVRNMFDPEYGDFVPNLIQKKKLYPILNRATEEHYVKFTHNLDAIIDGNKTINVFKENNQIHASIMAGSPILKQPTDETYTAFFKTADLIHPGLFKPLKSKKGSDDRGGNKFSLFGKKK
ncbi:hypothetical protein [Bacillus thuringiensis]|uniref:hypothetical protein n=1 Tax=Bacillus thuringiensis TaxID=1428 RepID=UPI0021D67B14|nr:hypothetical protein [Bacillus thuringiensis]MCU7666962.1 hypothetical protein [Bacillus thuringiensis]